MDHLDKLRDQVLVTRAQLGDNEAFTRLVERYHNHLLYYVRRMVVDESSAEDVLQELWLTAYRKLARIRRPEAFVPWIYGIARNKALQQLRRRCLVTSFYDPHDEPINDDESASFSAEDAALVHRCLARLSLEHREVLTLRFVNDMTYEQIASVIGCEIGTVRSRLYYAKRALKYEMEKHCHER